MLKTLIIFVIAAVLLVFMARKILEQKYEKKKLDYYSDIQKAHNQKNKLLIVETIESKVNYTGKYSVPIIITLTLLLMIAGSLVGLMLKNLFIGVIIAGFLGILPVIHMIRLETKTQILIAKTIPAYLSAFKTEFQLKSSLRESFIAMQPKVSHLIKKDYDVFVSELDQNNSLHDSLYKLGDVTRCVWFIYLGDLTEIVSARQDKSAVLRILDDLSEDCSKRLEEIEANQELVVKSGLFVILMLLILGGSLIISRSFLQDPYFYYVVSNEGRKQLNIGLFFAMFPVIIYFYRVVKREAML